MGESLDPSPLSRLAALRPDWSRTVAARRVAAGALVVLAAVAAFRPDPQRDRTQVIVAGHDLAPGVRLRADDLRLETRTASTIPDGSQTELASVVGATLAGPARRGEILTDLRVLGPRLAAAAAGPDARIVSLPLAETALLDVARPGDVVDVLAADAEAPIERTEAARPRIVAVDAVVVLVSPKQESGRADRVVLIALPATAANDVAAAALVQSVTLTFH